MFFVSYHGRTRTEAKRKDAEKLGVLKGDCRIRRVVRWSCYLKQCAVSA